ncbi:MAG: hypothetical protein AB7E72_04665 [Lysobacterales bacterium]
MWIARVFALALLACPLSARADVYWPRLPSDAELSAAAEAISAAWSQAQAGGGCVTEVYVEPPEIVRLTHKTDPQLRMAHLTQTMTLVERPWDFRAQGCSDDQPPRTRKIELYAALDYEPANAEFAFREITADLASYQSPARVGWDNWTASGKPPCADAVQQFKLDPNSVSAMRWDYADLRMQFDVALDRYRRDSGHEAHSSDNLFGMLPAVSWLAHQGGMVESVSKQFVFASDADRVRWQKEKPRHLPDDDAGVGTERALVSAIYSLSLTEKRKLFPGDVFYLALKLRNGDAREAMLLAHNTLRSLARENDNELTDVNRDIDFMNRHLESSLVRRNDLQDAGIWYHMFGTAFFEMQARGNWGGYTLWNSTVTPASDALFDALKKLNSALGGDPALLSEETRSVANSAAIEFEQWYRWLKDHQENDPDKYCYNYFGAQLGAWLYRDKLPALGGRAPLPAQPPQRMSFIGPLPASLFGEQVTVSLSPVDLRWEAGGKHLWLRQEDATLQGDLPLAVLPFFEEDTQSWGMAWSSGDSPYTLSLQATQDGNAHLLTVRDGVVYVHALPLVRGERFEVDIDPTRPPAAILRADGQRIEAISLVTGGEHVETGNADVQPEFDEELASAEREFQEAYEAYTRLITTGGSGSVEQALARYKAAYERRNRLRAEADSHR